MNMLKSIRVLLVEDEIGDARLVQIGLRQPHSASFDVICVDTLSKAQQQLAQQPFDVVLLDLSLPDSSGLDTVRMIKKTNRGVAIIVLTGQYDTEFALNTLEAGAADYLVKGEFSPDSLIRAIRYAMQRVEMDAHNRLLVAALEAAANSIVITDKEGYIEWANPSFCKSSGYDLQDVLNKRPAELIKSGLQDQGFYEAMWKTILKGDTWRGEIINRRKNGELYHEELSISPVRNEAGEINHFIGIKEDITERKRMEEELQRLARTDSLTGLFNRRVFLEHLEQETARLARLDSAPIALLMLDLDHFKRINDTYGHAAGDEVLRHFADLIRANVRSIDLPARLGGEEFAIILPGADRTDALAMAERLRMQVAAAILPHAKGQISYTVSIGVAALSATNANSEIALHHADSALYTAKSKGRNQTCWFSR
ncbi:MAG: diguanylate cyclase [Methylovulum sp.]|nr:diguanylate cyclase [Methylovulum sp.]